MATAVAKGGFCPAVSTLTHIKCGDHCTQDGDCGGMQKCCETSCGKACSEPASEHLSKCSVLHRGTTLACHYCSFFARFAVMSTHNYVRIAGLPLLWRPKLTGVTMAPSRSKGNGVPCGLERQQPRCSSFGYLE